MLKTCPDPVDVNDIQFKLHCSLKVFENRDIKTFQNNHNLISCASRYGLVFIGSNTANLKVIKLDTIENYTHKDKDISNFPRRIVQLPSQPSHVCVNCDCTMLAVVVQRDNSPVVIFYDVLSFYKQNVSVIREVRLSATPGTCVTEVNWNPALGAIFTACKSDGTLGIYEIKDNSVDINELPVAAESTSFCWSPRGKQIAVGSKNGNITQYKPDLKAVKVINAPSFEVPHSLISLCWVSNYQFIGVYQSAEQEEQAKLIVVDAPKTGETSYTDYDDVCYSGSTRNPQFFLILLQNWNLLMVSSSNSMELGVLGAVSEVWTQWNVPDFARAELPLSADKQDTLPVGMALDISSTKPLPWGEGTISPCPYLILLSHQGILYFYNVVNLKEGMPNICCPPDNVADTSGLAQFVVEVQDNQTQGIPIQPVTPPSQPAVAALPYQNAPQTLQSGFSFSKPATPQPATLQPTTPQPTTPQPTTPQPTTSQPTTPHPTSSFGNPQSAVPTMISLLNKPADNRPLFGNQVTITPVKPQPQTTAPLFGGSVTLTPVKPQQPATDTSEKYASIFAVLKAPSILPSPAESQPVMVVTKPEPQKSVMPILETPKSTILEIPKASVDPKTVIDEKVKGETQALLAKMVRDECASLESELKALLHQGRNINVHIGSDEEKVVLLKELQNLQDFVKEIVDISLGEYAEVHSLKQNLILSWAWYEEALSSYIISKDETMSLILNSEPLDSVTKKRQSDIKEIIYYLESQLSQANRAMDEQWDKFQDYIKKTYKVQMPTMETIFQTMVRQNAILQKQSNILKDISSRLKHRKINTPSLFVGLNMNRIEEDLRRLQLEPDNGHRIIYQQFLGRTKMLSTVKVNKLRDLLHTREVVHVTAVKPLLNNSLTKSPANRSRQLFSILGAKMSPVAKPTVVKNLQFSESTPLRVTHEVKPTTVPPNTPVQPDHLKTFTFKSLDTNAVTPPTNAFQPLSKSSSLLSNLNQNSSSSAFVLTTQASKNFALLPSSPVVSSSTFSFSPAVPVSTASPITTFNSASNKPESSSVDMSTVSSTKPVFNPSFATTQSLFSFGKTPSTTFASTPIFKSAPFTASTTSISSLATTTSPSVFSFSKSATVTTSIDTTLKNISSSNVPTSTYNFFNTASTQQSANITSSVPSTPLGMPISKPISFESPITPTKPILSSNTTKLIAFGSAPTSGISTTAAPAIVNVAKSISMPNFGPVTTASVAITTHTTSLYGSISSSSATSSLFGVKPAVSINSNTSIFGAKPASIADNTTSEIESTNSLSAAIITTIPSPTITTKNSSIFTPFSGDSSPGPFFSSVTPSVATSKFIFGNTTTSSTPSLFSPSTTSNVASTFVTSITTTPPVVATSVISSSNANTTSIFGGAPLFEGKIASIIPTDTSTVSSNVASNKSSIFGNVAAATAITTQSSIFGNVTAVITPITQSSAFGSTINTKQSSNVDDASLAIQSSIFGGSSTTTQSSILGTPVATKSSVFSTPTTTQSPLFAIPSTNTSMFGSTATTTQSIFSSTTQSTTLDNAEITLDSSLFESSGVTTVSSSFDRPTTTTMTSNFGNTSTQPSIFGGPTTTTQPSIFGSPPATQPSVFAGPATTTSQSVFGTTATTTSASAYGIAGNTSQNSIFGSSATTAQPSMFGTPTTTQSIFGSAVGTTQSSIFGGATTTQPSIFGAPATSQSTVFGTPATTSTSMFGNAGAITQTSVFGSSSTTTQSSIFGGQSSSTGSIFSNTPGPFGTVNATSKRGSIFGSASPSANSTSIFANTSTTSAGFGQTTGSIFGSTPFGSTPTTTAAFGQPSTFGSSTGSIFGGGSTFGAASTSNNVFGSAPNTSFSFASAANTGGPLGFGGLNVNSAPTTTTNVFGGSPSFGQTPSNPFARATNFETPASTTGSIFGGSTDGTFGSNTQNTFGSGSFGSAGGFSQQPNFAQSGFGQQSTFGSPSQSGPFSSGGVGVGQTGFGSTGSFQKSSGFGAAPVFGGSPQAAFGGSASFGGSPAFGGVATFGGGKVFGSSTPTAPFGSATGASPGFGNMATQNTVGFGNLAQQSASPTSSQFSGNSSFSSWR